MKKKKYDFFLVPTVFNYNYKSLFYNKKVKNLLNLQTNVFWASLSRFSHNFLAKQPVSISTLKILKKKTILQDFTKKLISHNFWISFTLTDLSNNKNITVNNLANMFDKKLNEKFKINTLILDSSNLKFLFDKKLFIETIYNKKNSLTFDSEFFLNKKEIYALSTSSDLYTFFIKYFSNSTFSDTLNLKKSDLKFNNFNIKNFFYETRFFIFFQNTQKSNLKFNNFFELVNVLKLKNSVIFLNGIFCMLSDFNYFNYYWNNLWSTSVESSIWKNQIDENLKNVFLKIFNKNDFFVFKKSFLLDYNKNIFSMLITKYYNFNKIIIFYYFIFILNKKLILNSNSILFILNKKLIFFLCQLRDN